MKKGISLIVSCSLVVAGGLFAQSPSPTVNGPTHGGPNKPAATDETQGGGQGGKRNDAEVSATPHHRHHRHHHTGTGEAENSKGPNASQSPVSGVPARTGGAAIPRASVSPNP